MATGDIHGIPPIDAPGADVPHRMERAVRQAMDLHATFTELEEPRLRKMVEAVLIELGMMIAADVS